MVFQVMRIKITINQRSDISHDVKVAGCITFDCKYKAGLII